MFNSRITTVLVPLVGLALLLWLAVSFEEFRLTKSMQSQLQGKADELDRQLGQLAVLPRVLAEHPDITDALKKPSTLTLNQANVALQNAQISSDSSFAFIMDTTGTTIAASNYQDTLSFVGINYGFRPYFKGAISGDEATFFAVGATTGVPGYFVANSIKHNDTIVGVVVVKSELSGLLDSWQLPPYQWLAVDELGVVILSTSSEYLYTTTVDLNAESIGLIKADRRYVPADHAKFTANSPERLAYRGTSGNKTFLVQRRKLDIESWELQLVIDRWRLLVNALLYVSAIGAIIGIAALGYRNIRAQKRLATVEQRHMLELEAEVEQRTAELRSAQEALISESNFAMLGRMSGAINHEINQPLASLRLNLATLRSLFDRPEPDMDELRQIVVDSDRTTKRIGRVVTTLRSLSGQQSTDHSELDVGRLIDDVIETVKRERPAMSKFLVLKSKTSKLSLRGNDVLLQQALLNLLYNAFDAVLEEPGPIVTIGAEAIDETIVFYVEDNGCGVQPELETSLFKPFVSDKQRTTGLGLGLTLAELIADDHDGRLGYSTRTPKGSTFTLTIPIEYAE